MTAGAGPVGEDEEAGARRVHEGRGREAGDLAGLAVSEISQESTDVRVHALAQEGEGRRLGGG